MVSRPPTSLNASRCWACGRVAAAARSDGLQGELLPVAEDEACRAAPHQHLGLVREVVRKPEHDRDHAQRDQAIHDTSSEATSDAPQEDIERSDQADDERTYQGHHAGLERSEVLRHTKRDKERYAQDERILA